MEKFDFKCRPTIAWLTVNRQCNFRCPWCYGKDTNYEPKDTMSLEKAKELVMIGKGVGVDYFDIIGGEPTLWPHLFDFNDFCKEQEITTCLVTNAALFGNDTYWEEYQKHPCDEVSISIKSASSKEFNSVTGSNLFDQTFKGVGRAFSYHNASGTTVYNSLLGIDGLKEIALKCKELGANFFVVDLCTPVLDNGEVLKSYSIEPIQLAKDIIEIREFLDELYNGRIEIAVYIPLCLFPESFIEDMDAKHQLTTVCQVYGRSGINFNVDGDIMVCNQLFDFIVAKKGLDFTDSASLMQHLNNKGICSDYKELLRFPSEECSECRWNKKCRGGCLLNWTLYDPSMCHAVI